ASDPHFRRDGRMCSRYALISPGEAVARVLGTTNALVYPPRYNIAPSEPVMIVRLDHRGAREQALVRWGFVPGWVKDPGELGLIFNARAETAADKPSFRGAMRHRRCLVPFDGYYDWTGERGRKQAFLIRPRGEGPYAFAGLWEGWLGADGSEIETMAIMTTTANQEAGRIGARMPVIVAPAAFADWLDMRQHGPAGIAHLLGPAGDGTLEVEEVSRRVNDPRAEGPGLWSPPEAGS
ncbi:MAG: SOS response-associated peptidase, partial [Hyphomicrobiaceae bacterium]